MIYTFISRRWSCLFIGHVTESFYGVHVFFPLTLRDYITYNVFVLSRRLDWEKSLPCLTWLERSYLPWHDRRGQRSSEGLSSSDTWKGLSRLTWLERSDITWHDRKGLTSPDMTGKAKARLTWLRKVNPWASRSLNEFAECHRDQQVGALLWLGEGYASSHDGLVMKAVRTAVRQTWKNWTSADRVRQRECQPRVPSLVSNILSGSVRRTHHWSLSQSCRVSRVSRMLSHDRIRMESQ